MSSFPPAFPSARRWITLPNLVFFAILGVGIFARIWEFPALPAGLNQDEVSIGLEAYDLLRYGVDRNNISFPVNFISWGDGMDSLYGCLLIPFVGFGLSAFTIRLPVLLSGILFLPLVYIIGKRLYGVSFGLLAMFFLAISPWHIVMSRWGINENILPFLFLMAFTAILASTKYNGWFLAGSFLLVLCLYAYGASYVAVPIFLLCAIPLLLRYQAVRMRTAVLGVCIFCLVSIPIVLFLLAITLRLPPLSIGPLTIPRIPMQPRAVNRGIPSGRRSPAPVE